MIHAPMAQAGRYTSLHPLFPKAFAFLEGFEKGTPDGRVEIEGDRLFAVVQRYQPGSGKLWEAHRTYGDIQMIFEGAEACGVAPTPLLTPIAPYLPEKDIEKFQPPGSAPSLLALRTGEFAVFYPEDAHQPGLPLTGHAGPVLKVVVKFLLG
jgi:YhcH/YjgK/YiaL family protein